MTARAVRCHAHGLDMEPDTFTRTNPKGFERALDLERWICKGGEGHAVTVTIEDGPARCCEDD